MSYKKLQVWQKAKELSIMIHEMSLKLPKMEQFVEAQQIRRSIKSVRSNNKNFSAQEPDVEYVNRYSIQHQETGIQYLAPKNQKPI